MNTCLRKEKKDEQKDWTWLIVGVLHLGNMYGHIRTGSDLWLCTHGDFSVLPHWDTRLSALWPDILLSSINLTLTQPVLTLTIIMPSAWLGSDKSKLFFYSTNILTHGLESFDLIKRETDAQLTWPPGGLSFPYACPCWQELCAVYREPVPNQTHTPAKTNQQAFAVQNLMEGFVNACFYHMWTGLLWSEEAKETTDYLVLPDSRITLKQLTYCKWWAYK